MMTVKTAILLVALLVMITSAQGAITDRYFALKAHGGTSQEP
jgi:hypothetical protein